MASRTSANRRRRPEQLAVSSAALNVSASTTKTTTCAKDLSSETRSTESTSVSCIVVQCFPFLPQLFFCTVRFLFTTSIRKFSLYHIQKKTDSDNLTTYSRQKITNILYASPGRRRDDGWRMDWRMDQD